jgi:hypothetical protein
MSAWRRSVDDPWFVALAGLILLVISLVGMGHSLRAGLAQRYYWQAKFAKPEAGAERVLDLCCKAYVLYPDNYYFSILAAEKAYYAASDEKGMKGKRLEQAAVWCERGLVQNWWKGSLRRLKTRILWEESPSRAIRFWNDYTEWQFWEPYNHAVLAELYAGVGDFENADQSLRWAAGTLDGDRARDVVEREKKQWKAILSGENEGWGE